MRVNDVFCGVSLSGTMQPAMSVLLEKKKNAFGGNASLSLSLRTQALSIFSNTQRLPVHVP